MDNKKLITKIMKGVSARVQSLTKEENVDDVLSIMDEFNEWIMEDFSDVIYVSGNKIIKRN